MSTQRYTPPKPEKNKEVTIIFPAPTSEAEKNIILLLAEIGTSTCADLSARLQVTPSNVHPCLVKLREKGMVITHEEIRDNLGRKIILTLSKDGKALAELFKSGQYSIEKCIIGWK